MQQKNLTGEGDSGKRSFGGKRKCIKTAAEKNLRLELNVIPEKSNLYSLTEPPLTPFRRFKMKSMSYFILGKRVIQNHHSYYV